MNCPKTFYLPSLSIVAQGARSILIGQEIYLFDKSQMIMNPITLPISLQTMKATKSEHILIIRLDINPQRICVKDKQNQTDITYDTETIKSACKNTRFEFKILRLKCVLCSIRFISLREFCLENT
jgi:hypothetical protein